MRQKNKTPKSPGVRFDLEDDAEKLFRETVENLSDEDIPMSVSPENISSQKYKRQEKIIRELDLHGHTVPQAKQAIVEFFGKLFLVDAREAEVTIITGKGRHSAGGQGTLVYDIHAFVSTQYKSYIVKIDTSPGDLLLEGVPVRGHFKVVLNLLKK